MLVNAKWAVMNQIKVGPIVGFGIIKQCIGLGELDYSDITVLRISTGNRPNVL